MSQYNNYEEVAVTSSSAVALTIPSPPSNMRPSRVLIQVNQSVRMRMDGTDPTISVGWLLVADSPIIFELTEDQAKAAKFIAESTSGVVRAIYL